MSYTTSRETMKLWDPQTKKLKYCSSEKLVNTTINFENDDHLVLS